MLEKPESWCRARTPTPPISATATCASSSGAASTLAGIGRKSTKKESL